MYKELRTACKKIFPQKFLDTHDFKLRGLFYWMYKGYNAECPLCNYSFRKYIKVSDNEWLCPRCGSTGKHRRLWLLLKSQIEKGSEKSILHFSPSKPLKRALELCYKDDYYCSEYESDKEANFHFDVQNIDAMDNSFDCIICYHILDYAKDDEKAIAELYRVMNPGGKMYVQSSFEETDVADNQIKAQLGCEIPIRVYPVNYLAKKLESAGFFVESLDLSCDEAKRSYYGFKENEYILLCTKTG